MFRRMLLCRSGGALALTLILVALAGGPAVSQEDAKQKQIKEVRDKIAELEKKLGELSKPEPAKTRRPLTFKDALAWKSAVRPTLSRNGKWFVCVVGGTGKSEVLARETATDKELRFPADGVGDLALSRDSRWLVFRSTSRQASPSSGGKATLVELATGQKTDFDGVQRFSFSGESGATLALHRAAKSESPRGSDLILHDLATRKDLVLGNVAQFAFDKKGARLTMLIDAQDQLGNGIQVRDMKTGELRQLESAKASFTNLSLSKDGVVVDLGETFGL